MDGFIDVFMGYIVEDLLIVVPFLWFIGFMIKRIPNVKDHFIPVILTIISCVVVSLLNGFTVDSIIQGVLISGVSVFGHQLIKQRERYLIEVKKDNGYTFKFDKKDDL